MSEPTALTMSQVASGQINYVVNCLRQGDQRDARRYLNRAQESLQKVLYLLDNPPKAA